MEFTVVNSVLDQATEPRPSTTAPKAHIQPIGNSNDLANLDLLRASAVCLVLSEHFLSTMKVRGLGDIGHFGVLLFFVHTSLVLMMSMQRLRLTGSRLYRAFMVRRIFRIYPLSIVAVLFAVTLKIPSTSWQGTYTWHGWAVFFSNIFLVQNVAAYGSVNCVLWSLPFEVQMYLILPLLFIVLRRFPSTAAAWWAWSAGIVIAVAEYLIRGSGFDQGFLLTRYFPCFIAGVLAWRLLAKQHARLPGKYWILALALLIVSYRTIDAIRVYGPAFLLTLHGGLRHDHQIWWPPYLDLVNDWFFCCVAGLAIPLFADIQSIWLNNLTRTIAKYSYGIYVCHVPILWLVFVKLHFASRAVSALLALALTAIISVALYRMLEDPAIRVGRLLATRLTRTEALVV